MISGTSHAYDETGKALGSASDAAWPPAGVGGSFGGAAEVLEPERGEHGGRQYSADALER